jgi:replicative DNA helicase
MSTSPFDLVKAGKQPPTNGTHAVEPERPLETYEREPEAQQKRNGKPQSEYTFERGMPISNEAERSILGAILLDNAVYGEIADSLNIDHFSLDAHRRIYRCMRVLLDHGKPCDMILLVEELDRHKEIEAIGGVGYLSSLIDGVPERPSIAHYARIVVSRAKLRSMINIAQNVIAEACEHVDEADEVIDRAETAILELRASDVGTTRAVVLRDFAGEAMQEVLRTVDTAQNRKVVGMTYGIPELDETTTGARTGEITLVAGRPGHAKSAFAEQMAIENAANGVNVGYFSHEMSKQDIFQRALCYRTGIDFLRIRSGNLSMRDLEQLAAEAKRLEELPLWVDDTPKLAFSQVLARSRMLLAKGITLFIYDFVQRIRVPGQPDPRLRVNDVSDGITAFAKDHRKLGVHCVMLSQLSKFKGEKETAPHENDVKESGNLYEDAHVCFLLYRPRDKNRAPTKNDLIITAKQRNGPTGPMGAMFDGNMMRWTWREIKKAVEVDTAKEKQEKLIPAERDRTGEKKEDF